jgi:hypothetical protein
MTGRTGSERDHGVNEREILALEVVDVSEHLGLGVVGAVRAKTSLESDASKNCGERRLNSLEDRLSQILAGPPELLREEACLPERGAAQSSFGRELDKLLRSDRLSSRSLDEDVREGEEIHETDTFVKSHSDGGVVDAAKVDLGIVGDRVKLGGSPGSGGRDGERVEEVGVDDRVGGGREGGEGLLEDVGEGVNLGGDSSKALGSVVARKR